MIISLSNSVIDKLIQIESSVNYNNPPPPECEPFVVVNRNSPILISAPHGCRTYRSRKAEWHEEDEYTAGLALLLGELCQVNVIATLWRTDDSDPNDTEEALSPYKKAVRQLCEQGIRWVIDLHGASQDTPNMADAQLVDLGLGSDDNQSLPLGASEYLAKLIEGMFGVDSAKRPQGKDGFPASVKGHSISAFVHQTMKKNAVQVEMKPPVRVANRRADSSMYRKNTAYGGPYSAPPQNVIAMMQALVEFINYLKNYKELPCPIAKN